MCRCGSSRASTRRTTTARPSTSTSVAAAVAVVVILAVAWVAYAYATRPGKGTPLSWRDLTAEQGPLQFPRPAFRVFLRRQKLVDYLEAVMPGRAPAAPAIDFARRKAVLIAAGPRSSTGYSLDIVRVLSRHREVVVVVRERTPSLGDGVAARVTYPYRLITIPRLDKPTALDFLGR